MGAAGDRVSIYLAALAWQQRFRDAEIPCALDQRDLDLPGVLIDPPTLVFKYAGVADAEWTVYLLTADAGTLPALAQLDALIARVFPVIKGHTTDGAVVRLTVGGGQAVGYRFSWTERITVGDLDQPAPEPTPEPETPGVEP